MIYAVALGIIVAMATLSLWRPSACLVFVFSAMLIKQLLEARSPVVGIQSQIVHIAVAVGVVLALVVAAARRAPVLSITSKVGWLGIGLYAWSGLSLLWTPYPEGFWIMWTSEGPYVLLWIILVPRLVNNVEDMRAAAKAIALGGGLVLALALFGFEWTGRGIQGAGRISGKGGNPLAPAQLGMFVTVISILVRPHRFVSLWGLLRWPVMLIALAVIVRSGSRGPLLGAVVASVLLIPLAYGFRRPRQILVVVGIVAIFAIALNWVISEYATGTRWQQEGFNESIEGRLDLARTAITAWINSGPIYWLIGMGTGSLYSPVVLGYTSENAFIDCLAELGLIGFTLLALLLARTAQAGYRLIALSPSDYVRNSVVLAFLGCVISVVIISMKGTSIMSIYDMMGLCIIIARVAEITAQESAFMADRPIAAEATIA